MERHKQYIIVRISQFCVFQCDLVATLLFWLRLHYCGLSNQHKQEAMSGPVLAKDVVDLFHGELVEVHDLGLGAESGR